MNYEVSLVRSQDDRVKLAMKMHNYTMTKVAGAFVRYRT